MLAFVHTLLRCSFEVGAFVMLKRIHIQHLTLGMYLHEFCGSWMEHPFWRAKFLLKDPDDLARIQATSIRECWIDTDKGMDVAIGTASISCEEVDAQSDTDFSAPENTPPPPQAIPPTPAPRNHAPTDIDSELQMAAFICRQSKEAVVSMFSEARMGRAVDTPSVKNLVEDISDSITRNPDALISLARLKTADDYTYMHSVAVCALMVALARQLKLDDEQTRVAGMAGLLHDLGKIATPMVVLKKPSRLTDQEFDVVRNHSASGYQILKKSGNLPEAVLDACHITVVPTRRVRASPAAAVKAAVAIGFPVVLKILSPQISHKSDVGGVALALEDIGSSGLLKDATLSFGATNLTDKKPPFVNLAQSNNGGGAYDPTMASPLGRVVSVSLDKRF